MERSRDTGQMVLQGGDGRWLLDKSSTNSSCHQEETEHKRTDLPYWPPHIELHLKLMLAAYCVLSQGTCTCDTVSGNCGCMLSTSAQKKLKRMKLIFLLLHLYSFPSACLFHFFHSPTMSSGQKGTKEVHWVTDHAVAFHLDSLPELFSVKSRCMPRGWQAKYSGYL